MEFLDEDARPRFLFQARPAPSTAEDSNTQPQTTKPFLVISICISSLLIALSIFFIQSEPFKSLLLWAALSLLLGPLAPTSITGGDIRVGQGPVLEFPEEQPQSEDDFKKRVPQKRIKPRNSEESLADSIMSEPSDGGLVKEESKKGVFGSNVNGVVNAVEEKEWVEEEIDILRKQLGKHLVGKPKRWEVITEAFKGRHKVDSVIKKAKELGERKLDDGDSYVQFLKKRKPVDKRVEEGNEEVVVEKESWSSGEDISLLNALKTFPKDMPMRWEMIAISVPGKSKATCIKRIAELKRDFRNSKAANVD